MILLWIATPPALHAGAEDEDYFGPVTRESLGVVSWTAIDEASGLAASRRQPGVLWTHNDSGDGPFVYAIDEAGRARGRLTLAGTAFRDVEDIALGPGPEPGVDYLYLGDTGNNKERDRSIVVYRFVEPSVDVFGESRDATIRDYDRLEFRYPDGGHDCEVLLLDPRSRDLYFITKRDRRSRLYRAAYPQPIRAKGAPGDPPVLEALGELDLTWAVAGDVSADGLRVLIKTPQRIRLYEGSASESLSEILREPGRGVPYVPEAQGEAVAWRGPSAPSGYLTLGEGEGQTLFFYPYPDPTPEPEPEPAGTPAQ